MKRILIVEDVALNLDLLVQLLEDEYELISADNGEDGVAMAIEHKPDLILMDLSMPGKGGVEATVEIRALEQADAAPPVPIVALTANAFAEDRDRCLAAGMDAFLSKPVRKKTLLATLQSVLRNGDADPPKLDTVA